ncbi:MAG: PAAR domain-containing protein, partial [Sandaracinaceae bacterium]
IGGELAARVGDSGTCPQGGADAIVGGAPCVRIEGGAASRIGDGTAKGGVVGQGCSTVVIGLKGVAGDPAKSTQICYAMPASRVKGELWQSFANCGVESVRMVLRQAVGDQISERDLLLEAMGKYGATDHHPNDLEPMNGDGGADSLILSRLLNDHGVPTSFMPSASSPAFADAIASGRLGVVGVDGYAFWPKVLDPATLSPKMQEGLQKVVDHGPGAWHAVMVSGVEYDADGNVVAYIVNDTGFGQCGLRVPKDVFDEATGMYENPPNGNMYAPIVTRDPV